MNPWYHLNSGKARTYPGTDMPASWLTGDDSVGTYWGILFGSAARGLLHSGRHGGSQRPPLL